MGEARDSVVQRLAMTDPADPGVPLGSRPLPDGASEARLGELEAHFGKPFPPSYKHFLRSHDGAPWADLGTHFFPAAGVLEFDRKEKSKFFGRNLTRVQRDSSDGLIVFAASPDRNTTVLFDSGAPDAFGEWPVTYLSKRDKVLYTEPDFVQYLLGAAHSLARLRSRYG